MKTTLLLLLLAVSAQCVVITVKTTGGDYPATEAGLRAALADVTLTCGSELQIEAGVTISITGGNGPFLFNKNCTVGNEVTITTTLKTWLPDHTMRITPSYRSLVPILYLPSSATCTACPILNISTLNGATAGIIVRGIGFLGDPNTSTSSYSVTMLNFGQDGVCGINTTFASNMTAEHLLFLSSNQSNANGHLGGGVNISGRGMQLLNSWVEDVRTFGDRGDAFGSWSRNGGRDYEFRNNHFGAGASEGIIIGVTAPFCQVGLEVPTNITVEHNHLYNSLKWVPGSSTYLGGPLPVMKNHFECKGCENVNLRWNQGENQWFQGQGQWYAVTLTPRLSRDASSCEGPESRYTGSANHPLRVMLSGGGSNVAIGYLNADTTYHACTVAAGPDHCDYTFTPGWANGLWAVGGGISVNSAYPVILDGSGNVDAFNGWAVSTINSVTDQFHFTVSPALPMTANDGHGAGIGLYFDISNVFNRALNINIYGNYWKNAAQDGLMVLRDGACGGNIVGAPSTTGGNFLYSNNLHVDSDPNFMNCCGMAISAANFWYVGPMAGYYGDNLQWLHNTRYQTPTAGANISPADRLAGGYTFDALGRMNLNSMLTYNRSAGDSTPAFYTGQFSNNLLLPAAGVGMVYPPYWSVGTDGMTGTTNVVASQLLNNAVNGAYAFTTDYSTCPIGNRLCANPAAFFGYPQTYTPQFRNEAKNGFTVTPASIYHNTGADGRDVGTDMRSVAAIQDLTVTPTDVAAWFRFVLPGAICQLPAQIEVSSDPHLTNDLGTYTVVNAINPTMFIRSDSDQVNIRSTPAGCSRMMMIGDNTSATDDNAVSRDLRLAPSTIYYYRLSAGGAMERGSFTTTGAATPPASWPVNYATPTSHLKVRSGPNIANLVTGSVIPCGPGGCTFSLTPDANSRQLVYYIDGCNAGGVVSNTWGPYFRMVLR